MVTHAEQCKFTWLNILRMIAEPRVLHRLASTSPVFREMFHVVVLF